MQDHTFIRILATAEQLIDAVDSMMLSELEKKGITDISPCCWDIFAYLYGKGTCTVSDLAEATSRAKPTTSLIVKSLVKKGYLERHECEKDSRVHYLALTERGKSLQPVFELIAKRLCCAGRCGLGAAELKALDSLLTRSLACVTKPRPQRGRPPKARDEGNCPGE